MMLNRTQKEIALIEAIKSRAICTAENTNPPPKAMGENMKWLLDIRRLFLNSHDLELITEVFWDRMETLLPFQIGGLELGAVPLVSALLVKANQRGHEVNGFVVRKSRKKSGLCRQIEGELNSYPIVVVDDLVNTGSSLKRVKAAVEQEGLTIRDFFVFVDFTKTGFKKYADENNIKVIAPFTISDLGLELTEGKKIYPSEETLGIEWMFSPPDPNFVFVMPKSAPILYNGLVLYGADNGYFYAVENSTGKQKWKFKTGESIKGIFSSPVVHGNGVIFGAYDGTVYNLDCNSGEIIWRYDAADAVGSSPALAEDLGLVFIGLEQNIHDNKGSLVALDLNTGTRIWEYVVREYLHATPNYCKEKQRVVVGSNDKKVFCFDARNGNLEWEFAMKGELKACITFDAKRNQIIAPSFDWNCYAIDIDTGSGTVLFTGNHAFYNTALLVENRLYVGSCGKTLYIYDLQEKRMINKIKTMGRIMSHPTFVNGKVYFGCNDGCIREIDLDGRLLGGLYLPERSLTPIVYDAEMQRFYVVTAGNHLISMRQIEQ